MKAITVVIPVYNVEKFLGKAVDSVLAQSFDDYEIILVDDGSTDFSGTLCDDYSAKYPFISTIHQENKGLGGARNTGIRAAQGKYVLFLDSDDYIHPDMLQICYSKAEQYNCDMVLFDLISVYEDGIKGVRYTCDPTLRDVHITDDNLKPICFCSSACNRMCKKSLFTENNIFFPDKVWYEDLHTMPKLIPFIESAYYYTEQPLYFYLQRQGSIMHTPDLDRIVRERLGAINEIRNYYNEKGYTEKYKEELEYMYIFHGFFLPVREMQAVSAKFEKYADQLLKNLQEYCKEPLKNKYISTLSGKEQQMLKWFLSRKYTMVKILSSANKLIKGVKKCFQK